MKRFLLGALASFILAGTAGAENLPVEFTGKTPADSNLGLRAHIDFKTGASDYGNAYPNMWIQLPGDNSTNPEAAAEGEAVFAGQGDIVVTITGPEGYTHTATLHVTPAFPQAETHAWEHIGVISAGDYTFEAAVSLPYADKNKGSENVTFTGTFVIPEQVIDPSAKPEVISFNVGEFTRTGSTSGLLPYSITLSNDDLSVIDYVEVWASRVGDEEMNVTNVGKNLAGDLELTVLPENAKTDIWPKVKLYYTDGTQSGVVQTATNVDTRDLNSPIPSFTLLASNPWALSTTTGTVDYEIAGLTNAEKVENFVVYCVFNGESVGVTGDVTAAEITTNDLTGTLELSNLPENTETQLYVKAYANLKDGGRGEEMMFPNGENWPAGAGPWYGLVIRTGEPVETVAPTYVPEITLPESDVLSVFSSYGTVAYNIGWWGQSTQCENVTLEGGEAIRLTNFNYLGWELVDHLNISDYDYMSVSYYACQETGFGFTPISPDKERAWIAPEVKVNEWNTYNVPLSYFNNVDMGDIFQIKFDLGKLVEGYLANVYFYKDENKPEPPVVKPGATFQGTGDGVFSQTLGEETKEYPYELTYTVVYNEDHTLTVTADMNWIEGEPVGIVAGSVFINNELNDFAMTDGLRSVTTTSTYTPGDMVGMNLYIPVANGVFTHEFSYVVGTENVEVSVVMNTVNEEAPIFFNLQGARVDNPAPGQIVIRVCNGKAVKTVVR